MARVLLQILVEIVPHLKHSHQLPVRFPDAQELGGLHLPLRHGGGVGVGAHVRKPLLHALVEPQGAAAVHGAVRLKALLAVGPDLV